MCRDRHFGSVTQFANLLATRVHTGRRENAPTEPWHGWDGGMSARLRGQWGDQASWSPAARRRRRGRLTRRRMVWGAIASLTLLVVVLVAIGPAHLFAQAASDYTIYNDTLAPGWRNWSYQSTVNLANTAPVAAGARSIAWTPDSGWATLYLRAGSPLSLADYSSLRFAMRASRTGQRVGVALTNASNHAIAPLAPLSAYGGSPPVGSWAVYTIPRLALAPHADQAYGVMLQNWSNYPAPTLYVDGVMLLARSAAPSASAATATPLTTITAQPTPSAPASTASPAQPTASAGPADPALSNAPDTTSNIHVGLPATDHVGSGQYLLAATPPVREVWNWNGGGSVAAYPTIYAGRYFPVDRQPDTRYNVGAQPLSWFLANHPDWIEYKCDRSTVAYEFGQTTDIPLDTSNPAVLSWLKETFYAPAAQSGYGHLDFDNFQMSNAGSWSGQRCGHWSGAPGASVWVAQYKGTSDDPNYRANEIAMARNLRDWLRVNYPRVAFAANFSYDNAYPADSDSLMSHVDILFDEQGFTNPNGGSPYRYTDAAWLAKAQHTWNFISAGHGWQDINQFGASFSALSNEQKQWAIANYLLLKNNASWLYLCGPQEYGTLLMTPEYAAEIGSPTDTYHQSQGVYIRTFTNGLALVNPSGTGSYSVTLSGLYRDLYGHSLSGQVTLPPASAQVLLRA